MQKNLLSKAIERRDLANRVIDEVKKQGLVATYRKVMNRLSSLEPLGYSCAGVVIGVGDGAEEFSLGERVACSGTKYAHHAEIVFVPKNLCVKVPENVSLEEGTFAAIGAIALHALRQAQLSVGESCAVIGLGLVGQILCQLTRASGCMVLGSDLNPFRQNLAQQLGANLTCGASTSEVIESAQRLSGGRGLDAVFICADTKQDDLVELAGQISRDRGKVVVVGNVPIVVPRQLYYEKELQLVVSRSLGAGRYDPVFEEEGVDYPLGYVRWTERRNMEAFLALLSDGKVKVNPLISHRFEFNGENALAAYDLIEGKTGEKFLAVMFSYPHHSQGVKESGSQTPRLQDSKTPIQVVRLQDSNTPTLQDSRLIRFGVIGAGSFAKEVLLPHLKKMQGVALRGVCTASSHTAREAAERFGFAYCTCDCHELLCDPQVDAIVIATRHHLHASLAAEALRQGKAVFVEKPLALNEAQLEEVISAISYQPSAISLLMVDFNRRFAPLTLRLKEFLSARSEPMVLLYRINSAPLPLDHWLNDPRQGGGRIVGEACHFFDLLRFLCGSPIVSVMAQALCGANHESRTTNHENVCITLRFGDGSLGTVLYCTGERAMGKERLEVFCGGACAVLDDFQRLTLFEGGKRKTVRRLFQDKGHCGALEAFLSVLRSGGESPIPFSETCEVTRATFAAVKSLAEGRAVDLG